MTADAPRAQLIHIETDRRLGHEWDEWDGRPLPGNGDFSAPPGLFFRFAALTIGIRSNPRTARAAGDPRAPPPRGRRGSVRAGHDDRAPRRGWPVAGARAHHAPPERTVPRRDARPRHHGGVGEGLGGGVGRPSSWAAFGTPKFCFSLSTNRCAIL